MALWDVFAFLVLAPALAGCSPTLSLPTTVPYVVTSTPSGAAVFIDGQQAGIANETVNNSAAYIQRWFGRLRHDKQLLVQAAAQAQRAADFILGANQT